MSIIKATDVFAEVIESNTQLLPVINRFNISLGLDNQTVEEICKKVDINLNFFLAILNTYQNPNYFHKLNPNDYSILEVVNYLKKTHAYYINYALPKLEKILQTLNVSCQVHNGAVKLIHTFYQKYKEELIAHIEDEESRVFTYIGRLVETQKKESDFSILTFEKEHTNVEEKINDLKTLIVRHIPPTYNQNVANDFLIELSRFEKDISDHARIEDNLLIPMVKHIENTLSV
ncbi:MAG: hypothetical protein C0599_03330 [Salinivirgaceae bacterium]|nr:MAG: hypothetical protein C0599_03330 [Salinivirgaceae bacterium]